MLRPNMADIEIFWGSGSQPAWRVLLALEVKGLEYRSHLLSFSAGDLRKPEFLELNFRHKVPVLRHGDYVLYESLAILAYLDAKFPETPILGTSPEETGRIWRYVSEFENYLEPVMHEEIVRPLFFGRTEQQGDCMRENIPRLHEELAYWERSLGGHSWLVGKQISAADIVVFPTLMALLRAARKPEAEAFDLRVLPLEENYPNLAKWQARIEALPGYENTFPPHWK